ncbi:MAG TPA: hypothetical protein EYP41_22085 [Anaerolineae bacterium]|nr:hypothetical protein [Anaerolineae bacterium]
MSLADHLRYLRALKGGPHIAEVAEAIGWEKVADITLAEKRYRPLEDEALMAKLADYYGRPLEGFVWHNGRSRKQLTTYIHQAIENETPVHLALRHGETLTGRPLWWDLAAVGLEIADGRAVIVLRHAVVDWGDE